jgi:hypothetical protein
MTGSAWIAGDEKLGMAPPEDDDYPLKNPETGEKEVSLPRIIVAQFDCIQNEAILGKLSKKVLHKIQKYLSSSPGGVWFTMYLVVFMLLHEVSIASKDRRRYALANGHIVSTFHSASTIQVSPANTTTL